MGHSATQPEAPDWERKIHEMANGQYGNAINHLTYIDWIEEIRQQREEAAREAIQNLNIPIGMLRQWLNENRITDHKKLITNEDIKYWLNINQD